MRKLLFVLVTLPTMAIMAVGCSGGSATPTLTSIQNRKDKPAAAGGGMTTAPVFPPPTK